MLYHFGHEKTGRDLSFWIEGRSREGGRDFQAGGLSVGRFRSAGHRQTARGNFRRGTGLRPWRLSAFVPQARRAPVGSYILHRERRMSYAALFAVAGDFGGRTCRRRRKQRVNGARCFVFISDLFG